MLKTLGGKKEHENQPAELYSIAVVDSEQRGGVAKGLFENLVDYFALRGYCSFVIRVGVHLSNAHAFYLKQGAVKQSSVKFMEIVPLLFIDISLKMMHTTSNITKPLWRRK